MAGGLGDRSLRSDGVVLQKPLGKIECVDCGLVRAAEPAAEAELRALYENDYSGGAKLEHVFYTNRGPQPRSALICDWIVEHVTEARLRATRSCLEVGAGAGHLLEELAGRGFGPELQGVEPGPGAAAASARGLAVRQGGIEAAPAGPFDAAYSVAVIEHVASPTTFLREVRSRLCDGGWLCLVQPTLDVPSYDLFFADHLSHFGAPHLRAYAEKTGFREIASVLGHPWMPNFSLHVWEAVPGPVDGWVWRGEPHITRCRDTAERLEEDVSRLDRLLTELEWADRGIAVFGTHEVYALARAYTSLPRRPLACALDDRPGRVDATAIGLPVVRPEEAPSLGVDDVILTMNTVYYEIARDRIDRLGLATHPFLTMQQSDDGP